MDQPETLDRVRNIIESVVKHRLADVTIVSIDIEPDVDEDGDSVYRITVVFDSSSSPLDVMETTGLVRRVLSRFAEVGEEAFPIFSFVAESELRRSKAGSA